MQTDRTTKFQSEVKILLGVFATLAAGALILIISNLIFITSQDWTLVGTLGAMGDQFGGFLNPILTFITFAGFIAAIWLQQRELSESRVQFQKSAEALQGQSDALNEQNYQASFFQMLAIHNDIVNAIAIEDPADNNRLCRGRDAFRVLYSNLRRHHTKLHRDMRGQTRLAKITAAYKLLYKEHQLELGHYFRYLYNMIHFLEGGQKSGKYIKLLRAQLSNSELLVLYYNCVVSPPGKKFTALAERYALFDNIPPRLLDASHGKLIGPAAFGGRDYESILRDAGFNQYDPRANQKL